MKFFRILRLVVRTFLEGTALAAVLSVTASAQSYPTKPITLIVSYPAGSAVDVTSRLLAAEMSKSLKQSIVVANYAGAGGSIASARVARAAPDGYTVLIGAMTTHVLNKGIYRNLPYDPVKDFVPVSRYFTVPNVLVVRSSLGVSTLPQLIELAKKKADRPLVYGSAGNGTSSHLSGAQLARLTGIELLHVPYQSTPAAVQEMLADRIDIVFGNINIVLPHIRSGALKPLVITMPARSALLPDVPTAAEAGIAQAEVSTWGALFLPAGTPRAIALTLNEAVRTAVAVPALRESYEKSGALVETDPNPESLARQIQIDSEKWLPVLKAAGVSVD